MADSKILYESLQQTFRHGVHKHKDVLEAVCVIVRYSTRWTMAPNSQPFKQAFKIEINYLCNGFLLEHAGKSFFSAIYRLTAFLLWRENVPVPVLYYRTVRRTEYWNDKPCGRTTRELITHATVCVLTTKTDEFTAATLPRKFSQYLCN